MKANFYLRRCIAIPAVIMACGIASVQAAPPHASSSIAANTHTNALWVESKIPQSVFVIPSSLQEGRDPFFPDSTRVLGQVKTDHKPTNTDVGALVLNGLSGTTERRLAMINGRTFGEGEEADVLTPMGRVKVQCLEIKTDSVVIKVGGQKVELHLRKDIF